MRFRTSKPPDNISGSVDILFLSLTWASISSFALWALLPLRNASFGLIDDHEFARLLGADGSLKLREIPRLLLTSTEVGQFGSSPRFRPVAKLLEIFILWLSGGSAGLIYVIRALLFIAVIGLSGLLVRQFLAICRPMFTSHWSIQWSFFVAYLCASIWVAVLPAWRDIVVRLGPSELFQLVGTAVSLYAILVRVTLGRPSSSVLLMTAVGAAIGSGSKEPGIAMLVPLACMLLRDRRFYRSSTQGKLALTATFALLLVPLSVLVHNALVVIRGSDVYGAPTSLTNRLRHLVDYILTVQGLFVIVSMLVVLVFSESQRFDSKWGIRVVGLSLAITHLVEVLVYSSYSLGSRIPRYDLVRSWTFVILSVIAASMILADLSRNPLRRRHLKFVAVALLVGLVSISDPVDVLRGYRTSATSVAEGTQATQTLIARLASELKIDIARPAIFISFERGIDYEILLATSIYLRNNSVRNPLYLWNLGSTDGDEFSETMQQVQNKGNEWLDPFPKLNPQNAVCITFNFTLPNEELPGSRAIAESCGRFREVG